MRAITISYTYTGDEATWRAAIDAFIAAVDADPAASGRFVYQVAVGDGGRRVHWGRWDEADTLAHVQSQPYFRAFAAAVKEFAGDTLETVGHDVVARTGGW